MPICIVAMAIVPNIYERYWVPYSSTTDRRTTLCHEATPANNWRNQQIATSTMSEYSPSTLEHLEKRNPYKDSWKPDDLYNGKDFG